VSFRNNQVQTNEDTTVHVCTEQVCAAPNKTASKALLEILFREGGSSDWSIILSLCLSLSVCLSIYLSVSFSLSPAHALSLSLSLSLSLFLSLSFSLARALSLILFRDGGTSDWSRFSSLFLSVTLSRALSLSRFLFLSLSCLLARSFSFSVSLSLALSLSRALSVCLSLALSLSLSLALARTALLYLSLSLSLALSVSISLSRSRSRSLSLTLSLSLSSGLVPALVPEMMRFYPTPQVGLSNRDVSLERCLAVETPHCSGSLAIDVWRVFGTHQVFQVSASTMGKFPCDPPRTEKGVISSSSPFFICLATISPKPLTPKLVKLLKRLKALSFCLTVVKCLTVVQQQVARGGRSRHAQL